MLSVATVFANETTNHFQEKQIQYNEGIMSYKEIKDDFTGFWIDIWRIDF